MQSSLTIIYNTIIYMIVHALIFISSFKTLPSFCEYIAFWIIDPDKKNQVFSTSATIINTLIVFVAKL